VKKDLLTLLDLSEQDFTRIFNRALELKKAMKSGEEKAQTLKGKILGLIFDKPSTRTRVSFEAGMIQLGGTSVFISSKDTQIARDEPVRDTARVLSRYLDGLVIRTFSQEFLNEFARFAEIPIINALTDLYHPTQVLCDLLTILEHKGGYENLKIAFVGDGNNVAHSWINASAVLGLNLAFACPKGYEPDRDILKNAEKNRKSRILVTNDPYEAVENADVIYTDVWASMGREDEHAQRKRLFKTFQVNRELAKKAAPDAIVMHCLPAHRGEEISEAVLEGPQSVVWDQSENKLHMNRAILDLLLTRRKKA
jgi:ornithine carbamoyltransferase